MRASITSYASDPTFRASQALARLPLFRGCEGPFIEAIVEQARRFDLKPDEDLEFYDGGPICIVENGTVRLTVGAGPSIIAGPGTVLNGAGFLGLLAVADAYRPRRAATTEAEAQAKQFKDKGSKVDSASVEARGGKVPPYVLLTNPVAPPPNLFIETWKKQISEGITAPKTKKALRLSDDEICFYNLCPHAASVGTSAKRPGGWMSLKIVGAEAGAEPLEGDPCHTDRTLEFGGARFVVVPEKLVVNVGSDNHPESLRCFHDNAERLKKLWGIVLKRCCPLFPGVPPHLMWGIAEIVECKQMSAGDVIVAEGDVGDDAESVRVLDEGEAVVEKLIGISPSKVNNNAIGRLGPGAVVGDICLAGAMMPRSASVRVTSSAQVVTIPTKALVNLMRYFPGMLACMGSRLRFVAGFVQATLPPCADVLGSVNLFAPCDEGFLRALSGDRRAFYGGHVFNEEEDAKGMVYVVEYGRCGVEVAGRGLVAEIPTGKCFGVGDPSIIGTSEITHKDASVHVVTPICIMLQIPKKALSEAFDRFAVEKQRFDRYKTLSDKGFKGGMNERIDVFRDCGGRFVDAIFGALEMRCYLPGQTIVVMGAQDASQMFILKSGHVALEKNGEKVAEMHTGATFGELVMLGVMRRRTITVRASTMCFTMEIPRATFLAAIEKSPEERTRFEQLAMRNMDLDSAVIWPVLKGEFTCPERMLLLVNLHAERRMCPVRDPFLATDAMKESAILLLQGSASIVDAEGKEIESVGPGECYNEQILLELGNPKGEYLVPKVLSEVQIVSRSAWEKVVEEFPKELDFVRKNILKHMAFRAESRLGVVPGSTTMLKSSSLFRGSSQSFVESLHKRLKSALYRPGKLIIEAGKEGDGFYLLLDGFAQATLREMTFELTSGAIFGEAVLIGIVKTFQKTVQAVSLCIVQKLRKHDFKEVLDQHPGDVRYFEQPIVEAQRDQHAALPVRVRQTMTFEHCRHDFLDVVCPRVDDAFFMSEERILQADEEFVVGKSWIYLLLAGQAVVENQLGVTLGVVNPGEILGEAALVGLASGKRTANVRAWSKGLVHCAKIPSTALEQAFAEFPSEKEVFITLGKQRFQRNQELIERRTCWLNDVAIPALKRSYLFEEIDVEDMRPVAATLAETIYAAGEVIACAGERATTMIMLLEGVADVESKCGMAVGSMTEGAIIGEVAVMNIFATRTATVRAYQRCRVIHLAAEVLARTTQHVEGTSIRLRLEQLAECRHSQTRQGLPLSALPLGVSAEDLCVRAVALQAHRIDLLPGECLEPLTDRSPCGPHFSVLVKGRVNLEMVSNGAVVTALTHGSLILEGVVADFNAHLRAKSTCELYRVRQYDFMIAVLSVCSAHDWFYRFRLLERETKERLHVRLKSAQGALQSSRRPGSATGRQAATDFAVEGRPASRPQSAMKRAATHASVITSQVHSLKDADQEKVGHRSSSKQRSLRRLRSLEAAIDPERVARRNKKLLRAIEADQRINGPHREDTKQSKEPPRKPMIRVSSAPTVRMAPASDVQFQEESSGEMPDGSSSVDKANMDAIWTVAG